MAALLIAPLVAIPPLTRMLVDRAAPALAHEATSHLQRAFEWRPVYTPRELEPVAPEATSPLNAEPQLEDLPDVPSAAPTQPGAKRHRGIVVRANAVVRAVRSGGRPSSSPAPASGQRPAGLSLVGVSRYGTGLRDGDILTAVGGTPATSEGVVVALVAGAISQGAKVITGVVWRDDQRFDVAVEIPGPEAFKNPRPRKQRKSVPQ